MHHLFLIDGRYPLDRCTLIWNGDWITPREMQTRPFVCYRKKNEYFQYIIQYYKIYLSTILPTLKIYFESIQKVFNETNKDNLKDSYIFVIDVGVLNPRNFYEYH